MSHSKPKAADEGADFFETVFPLTENRASVVCPIRFWSRTEASRIALKVFTSDPVRAGRTTTDSATAANSATTSSSATAIEVTSPASPEVLTYAELDARISAIQGELQRLGPGFDHLPGLIATSTVETVATLFACFRERCSIVLLSTKTPRGELTRPVLSFQSSGSSRQANDSLSDTIDLDGIATAIFTSGSSGKPKMAAHSIRNFFESARAACLYNPLRPDDNWLLSLELSHVGGLGILFRTLLSGASMSMVKSGWSPKSVRLQGVTHCSLVAAQLKQVLDLPSGGDDSSMNVLVGGGPIPANLIQRSIERGYMLRTTYGLTEFSSQVSTSAPWTRAQQSYSAGIILDHCEARVDENGVLFLRGKSLFLGYLEDGRIVRSTDADGWFRTGDLVRIDGGELFVLGRSDFMFISGGENIHPEEVEEILLSLNGVKRAVVVPVDDVDYGSRPVAFVDVNVDETSLEQVRSDLATRLPDYKIPDHFFDFPPDILGGATTAYRTEFQRRAAALVSG